MGKRVPHGLEAEDMGLPVPGCRLTALLCAPDLLPTEVHVRSLVFCRTSSAGAFAFALSPVDGHMIAQGNGFVIKPVVEAALDDPAAPAA